MKQQTLFDMIEATIHTGQPSVEDKADHTQDSNCTVGPDGVCLICGVYHGEPCPTCNARGYHLDDCPYMLTPTGPPSREVNP